MYNFKFNFLSGGQRESSNLDKIFLPLLKVLPCYEIFLGNILFAIIVRMFCRNHLKYLQRGHSNREHLIFVCIFFSDHRTRARLLKRVFSGF